MHPGLNIDRPAHAYSALHEPARLTPRLRAQYAEAFTSGALLAAEQDNEGLFVALSTHADRVTASGPIA